MIYPVDVTTAPTLSTPPRPGRAPMSPSNADIVRSFLNTTIDLIISLPTYEITNAIHLNLNQNAAYVDLHLGDGLNKLLPLTISTTVYNTLSTVPFDVLTNPYPRAMGTNTAIQIAAITRSHTKNTRMWREYQATDKSLKQLLIGAVGNMYTSAKNH